MENVDLPGLAEPLEAASSGGKKEKEYVVVARRYRPQAFADLVGQEHVARALSAAITTNRVGHAYLFTGARGVGKTSAARILAKCLNCEAGPAPVPCDRCDSCQAIASGDDVDVLEIDGASNRGIEEMRELRHNVAIRPSRSRFKIYIIDEVHMLTREAFNALLKTLEEPPEHVKFIFCTTEAEKIPITILSRCQRFDFAGIQAASIVGRLQQIVAAEGIEAEPAALALLSRRAAGSMRDSQSLLEQLLAVGGKRITVADVNSMLGTASDERLAQLVENLVARNAAGAIANLDAAVAEGVDTGQLLDQLLIYLRDLMVAGVGAPPEIFLQSDPAVQSALGQQAQQLGLATILAMMQVVDQTMARLRYSTHGRVLAELALVRICQLADLEDLANLIEQFRSGTAPSMPRGGAAPATLPKTIPAIAAAGSDQGGLKKNAESTPLNAAVQTDQFPDVGQVERTELPPARTLTTADADPLWQQTLARLQGIAAVYASETSSVAISAPNLLVATFVKKYNSCKVFCEQPEQAEKIAQALSEVAGQPMRVSFVLADGGESEEPTHAARPVASRDRIREKTKHPMVSRAMELFEARPVRVDDAAP